MDQSKILLFVACTLVSLSLMCSVFAHTNWGVIWEDESGSRHWRGLWVKCALYPEGDDKPCQAYYTAFIEVARVFLLVDHTVCLLLIPALLATIFAKPGHCLTVFSAATSFIHCVVLLMSCAFMTADYKSEPGRRILIGCLLAWLGFVLSFISIFVTTAYALTAAMKKGPKKEKCPPPPPHHRPPKVTHPHADIPDDNDNCNSQFQKTRTLMTAYNYECEF